MNTTRSVLLALLSLGFLVVSANAQNANATEVEKLKAEIARLKAELATRPEDIDRLREEAGDFFRKGKYREAKASMTRAYAAFERLEVKDKAKRVGHLRFLANISNKLQENDKTIEYATEVAIHALTDDDRGFATGLLGEAYRNKGEYDKAIGYDEKALAIRLKALGAEHPDVGSSYCNLGATYKAKGDKATAMAYLLKAKAIYLKKLGAQHPNTKAVQSWIDGINEE
jgi:tetratricopeptide (TPR) repeat protein